MGIDGNSGDGQGDARLLLDIDYITGVGTLFRPDGKHATVEFAPTPGAIARSVYLMGLPFLVATTTEGEDIAVELPTVDDHAPLAGRRVVYLDQQAWSKLALARYQPELLKEEELDAARWLIGMAEQRSIVLPYSAGVLSETTHWADGARRRNLALTVAQLSHGWQMLDPLAIRAREFEHVLAANPDTRPLPTVWTLTPSGAMATRITPTAGEGLPPDLALTANAATSVLADLSTILDDEAIPRTDARGWADHWAGLAAHVAESRKPKHLTVLAVHGAFIGDATGELAKAAHTVGLTPEAFSRWVRDESQHDLGALPALGLAREVMMLKILNRGAKWEPNDLVDIFYLVQAAGYADAVVGERSFVALIQSAQRRLAREVTAHSSLAALMKSGALQAPV